MKVAQSGVMKQERDIVGQRERNTHQGRAAFFRRTQTLSRRSEKPWDVLMSYIGMRLESAVLYAPPAVIHFVLRRTHLKKILFSPNIEINRDAQTQS